MSRALLSLAGFEVTLIGRFWVTAEVLWQGDNVAGTRISIFELPSETLTLIDEFHGGGCPNFQVSAGFATENMMHFASGYFYLSAGGTSGNPSAGRVGPLFCPGSDDIIIGQ